MSIKKELAHMIKCSLDSLNNLDKTFSNVMQTAASAYSAAHSSGSGGGGGFSGGGGGRRRRWKLWW